MKLTALRWFLPLLFLGACAIQEPPPGGPEDRTPPEVVATVPANGTGGVLPDAPIRIEFSENMARRNLERRINFFPPSIVGKAKWDDNTLVIRMDPPLHPDTTFIVEVPAGVTDAHDVRMEQSYRFAFATSAAIDSGVISGRVYFRRQPSKRALVHLWVLPVDSGFAAESARPQRSAHVNGEGDYELKYLPVSGKSFVLWAFEDANSNAGFDATSEAAAALADTVTLEGDFYHSAGNDIFIVDPKEPADVEGTVVNNTEFDSVLVTVTMRELTDTLATLYYTVADMQGNFKLAPLQGAYEVTAFLDFARDSLCGAYPCADDSTRECDEPCAVYPDTVVVKPGDKVRLNEFVLGPPREEKE